MARWRKPVLTASITEKAISRVSTQVLRDPRANHAAAVEKWADTTMTDGMIADLVRVDRQGGLEVVASDARLRWPDGFAWAPNGDLYVTASALHQTLAKAIRTKRDVEAGAPYHVLRLRMP